MIDKYFEWNIDGMQANTVLEGAEVIIPLDIINLKKIIVNDELFITIKNFDNKMQKLFRSKNVELSKDIINEIHLSYMINPNKNEYYIGFDYNNIFNNILRKLRMGKHIKTKSIDSFDDKMKLIEEIKKEIIFQNHIRQYDTVGLWNNEEKRIIANLFDNIEKLIEYMKWLENIVYNCTSKQIENEQNLREKKQALSNLNEKNKFISWKDLMFYTSIKALNIYEKTGDKKYYNYAKNYYLNVSRDQKTEYPASIRVDGVFYDFKFDKFNNKFMKITKNYFSGLDLELGFDNIEIIYHSINDGLESVSRNNQGSSKKKIVKSDYKKVESAKRKIKFYKGLVSNGKVICGVKTKEIVKSDLNYRGFIFKNNYVVFDKFYELSKEGKSIPAYGSAVYITSLDVAVACDFDRAKIRKYIKKNHDYKAFRLYHNDSDSYQERIKEVLDYTDVSTIKYNELKLLNKKRD